VIFKKEANQCLRTLTVNGERLEENKEKAIVIFVFELYVGYLIVNLDIGTISFVFIVTFVIPSDRV